MRPAYYDEDSSVARQGHIDRGRKKNPMQKALNKVVQSDEQTRINKHGEAVCYGCLRRDVVLSSLYYCCRDCMERRGKTALYSIVFHKPNEELCDFCGRWALPFDSWQINCSLCGKCSEKVVRFHAQYRASGGLSASPFYKKMRYKFGKDYQILMAPPKKTLI